MHLEFLISTTNKNSSSFLEQIFQNIEKLESKIVCINQCIDISIPELPTSDKPIKIISVQEKGVSRSRNKAIKYAEGDICVIGDDDLIYLKDCEKQIKMVYENNPDVDVALFQIITPKRKPYKKYHSKPYELKSPFKMMRVSSVEITFRRNRILEKNIQFNENLGLGAPFTKGEEAFFIKDCIKKGLKIRYFPTPIVIHSRESSGKKFTRNNIIANGIVYVKLFPLIFPVVSLYFSIKKHKRYKHQYSFLQYLTLVLRGNRIGLFNKFYR